MLTKVLKGNQNFIPIMIFILWVIGFFLLNTWNQNLYLYYISTGLITINVLIIAFGINSIPYFKNNHYFTFIWALTSLFILCCLDNLSFYGGLFFLLLIFTQLILSAQGSVGGLFNGFDLGFYLGIAIILHPPFWIFGVVLFTHFLLLGMDQIRNLLFYLLGLLALFLLAIEVVALLDVWELYNISISKLYISPYNWNLTDLFLLPIVICGIIAGTDYFKNLNRQPVDKKAIFTDCLLWLSGAVVYIAFYGISEGNALILVLLPILIFITNYLRYAKVEWHKEVVLWIVLVSLVLYKYHGLIEMPSFLQSITF